ncbi:MAG: hypothetical protein KA831_06890 [Pyrinomonadaceae bacterium]|nr:hypothetical protein [Pyrinomonadaceae bacterium]
MRAFIELAKIVFGAWLLGFCFCSGTLAQKVVEAVPGSAPNIMGSLVGKTYTNPVLGFSMELHDGGVVLNSAEIEVYKNAGIDNLKNGNNNEQIEAGTRKEIILINYMKKPVGSTSNSILVISALKSNDGTSAAMVVAATLRALSASGKFEITKSLSGMSIGGLKAEGIEGSLTVSTGAKITQRLLVVIRNGYTIALTVAGTDDEGWNSAQDLLDSLKFFKK